MLKPAKSLLKASSAAITSGDIVMTRKLKKALRRGPATAGAVQESNTFRIAYNRQEGKQKMKNDDLKKYIKDHIDNIDDNQLLLFIYKLVINLMQ